MQVLPLFMWCSSDRLLSDVVVRSWRWVLAALIAALATACAHAQTPLISTDPIDVAAAREPAAASGEVLYLFQRIAMQPSARSATIYIDFTPGAWRVGSSAGPAATKAQLKTVFGHLQHLIVAGRCTRAAIGASHRPCAGTLGAPDFAGIVNPQSGNEVFGWVATAPATPLGAGDSTSTAMRYFGLLSPMRYASLAIPGAIIAFRYREAAAMQLPAGLDRGAASLIIHNDRLPPIALQTAEGYEALVLRAAGR